MEEHKILWVAVASEKGQITGMQAVEEIVMKGRPEDEVAEAGFREID